MLRLSFLLPWAVYGSERFGPKHCVSVAKDQSTGTCVLKTNCEGLELDQVEFSFTCSLPGIVQKHSFGKGGFDAVEEFDTSVKCDSCGLPTEVAQSLKKAVFLGQQESSSGQKKGTTTTTTTTTVTYPSVSYGPSGCIETWIKTDNATVAGSPTVVESSSATPAAAKSAAASSSSSEASPKAAADSSPKAAAGTTALIENPPVVATDGEKGVCFVRTRCANVPDAAWKEYPIGVIALDKTGIPVRHLFGKNSFDKAETFNTLIRASECIGMDETAESITLENELKSLSKITYSLKAEVADLKKKVTKSALLLKSDHRLLKTEARKIDSQEEEEVAREEEIENTKEQEDKEQEVVEHSEGGGVQSSEEEDEQES